MHETVDSHELLELLARLNRLLEEHHHENLNHRLEVVNNFLKDELNSEQAYVVFAPQRHERQEPSKLRILWDTHEPENRAELDEEALGLHEITLEALAPLMMILQERSYLSTLKQNQNLIWIIGTNYQKNSKIWV